MVEACRNAEHAAIEVLGARYVNSEVGQLGNVQGVGNEGYRSGIDDDIVKTRFGHFNEFFQARAQEQLRGVGWNIARQDVVHVGVRGVVNKDVIKSNCFVDDIVRHPTRFRDVEVAANFGCAQVETNNHYFFVGVRERMPHIDRDEGLAFAGNGGGEHDDLAAARFGVV